MKPRIFIGSSSEGRRYAEAIQANLQPANECVVWDQEVFNPSRSYLEDLVGVDDFDFAIFVLSPDDKIQIRGNTTPAARDNIIFELGLFMGKLGRNRTFIVKPSNSAELRLPTDLLGISTESFDAGRLDGRWKAALGSACADIQKTVDSQGPIAGRAVRDTSGSSVHHVAAVCYQLVEGTIKILLVNSTRGRRIFPKGRMRDKEDPTTAVVRFAYSEGGVHGWAVSVDPKVFRYFKDEEQKEHSVAAILVEVHTAIQARTRFRQPEWFTIEEAKSELSKDREWDHSQELIEVVQWATMEIRQLTTPRFQAGVVPFRKSKSAMELLLITSKTRRSWIFPKGTIGNAPSPADVAVSEAFEEAGVSGKLIGELVGRYRYSKLGIEYNVDMFAMEVDHVYDDWPEKGERSRKWVSLHESDRMIEYEHVKQILLDFTELYGRVEDELESGKRQSR